MVVHPPPVLLNMGRIEHTKGQFSFYTDGCTPSVCKVIDALDSERMAVAKALHLQTSNFLDIDSAWYGSLGKHSTYEHIHHGSLHGFFPAPPSLKNRYIDEDMCYLLVPIGQLARSLDMRTPVIDGLIRLAEAARGRKLQAKRDFAFVIRQGETVEQMNDRLSRWL